MASISIGLIGPVTPSADVLTLDQGDNAGRQFICIRLGEDITVIGPGIGHEQIAYARALSMALLDAVATIERTLDMAASEGPSFNADAHVSIDEPIPPRGSYAD